MQRIPLTQGQFALVDNEDFERLNQYKWHVRWDPGTRSFYALRKSPARNGKQGLILMHREVVGISVGLFIDHVNHNTLDNRRMNLRTCSVSQNQANQRMRIDNASGFKGVDWNKEHKKWRARIGINGKTKFLGHYSKAEGAARAYDAKALELFGEFALTNAKLGLIPPSIEGDASTAREVAE